MTKFPSVLSMQEVAASRKGPRKVKRGRPRQKVDYQRLALSKGKTRRQIKGRKDRMESKVKTSVRQQCVDRDGWCRCETASAFHMFVMGDSVDIDIPPCDGPSQWAHLHIKRRSKTRGQAATVRHTTTGSLMLCRRHHDLYDGRQRPRVSITPRSDQGADGPLQFLRQD